MSEKGLPKESGRYLVYVGGGEKGVYPLDFETEYNDFGYWCLIVNSASLGVIDTIFETITERKEGGYMMHAVVTFICVLVGTTVGSVLGNIIKEALDDKFYRDLEKDMEEERERSRG